jgi:hypothetical protein
MIYSVILFIRYFSECLYLRDEIDSDREFYIEGGHDAIHVEFNNRRLEGVYFGFNIKKDENKKAFKKIKKMMRDSFTSVISDFNTLDVKGSRKEKLDNINGKLNQ